MNRSYLLMKRSYLVILSGLVAAGAIAGLSAPAHATLQVIADVRGTVSACVDNAACGRPEGERTKLEL
jgi:hypothetical protein